MTSEIRVGDRVEWTIYPYDGSVPYAVNGRVLDIRPMQSIEGIEYWATVEHDQYEKPFSVSVSMDRLARLGAPWAPAHDTRQDEDVAAAIGWTGGDGMSNTIRAGDYVEWLACGERYIGVAEEFTPSRQMVRVKPDAGYRRWIRKERLRPLSHTTLVQEIAARAQDPAIRERAVASLRHDCDNDSYSMALLVNSGATA